MFDDLYPVAVEAGDRHYRKARVFHRDGTVRLYVDTGKQVEMLAEGIVLESERKPGRRWVLDVETDDAAEVWDIRRVSGCGCGSRLKAFTVGEAWA